MGLEDYIRFVFERLVTDCERLCGSTADKMTPEPRLTRYCAWEL